MVVLDLEAFLTLARGKRAYKRKVFSNQQRPRPSFERKDGGAFVHVDFVSVSQYSSSEVGV